MTADIDLVSTSAARVDTIGTARRIDQLGRVVVPAELRKLTGIRAGDLLDFRADGHSIVMTKVAPEYAVRGRSERLM